MPAENNNAGPAASTDAESEALLKGQAAGAAGQSNDEARGQRSEDRGQTRTTEGAEQSHADLRDQPPASSVTDTDAADLAEHLNIPKEVRDKLPKAKAKAKPEARGQRSEDGAETGDRTAETGKAETETDDDDEPELDEKSIKGLPPKIQKRIGKLTKQRREALAYAARLEAELTGGNGEGRERQVRAGQAVQQPMNIAPRGAGTLGLAQNEAAIDQMTAEAEYLVNLAEENPDGMEVGEGENKKFVSADEMKRWARESGKVLRGAETRRRQLREFGAARQHHDAIAAKEWPELFKPDTKEFQVGLAILRRFPQIAALPEANYALGVMIEGYRAINARKGKTPNAERRTPNGETKFQDLDERLTPEHQREHIPPTTAEPPINPPSRNGNAARQTLLKKLEPSVERMKAPGRFSRDNLADALKTLSEDEDVDPSRKRVAV